jgi:hypothetical protein
MSVSLHLFFKKKSVATCAGMCPTLRVNPWFAVGDDNEDEDEDDNGGVGERRSRGAKMSVGLWLGSGCFVTHWGMGLRVPLSSSEDTRHESSRSYGKFLPRTISSIENIQSLVRRV